jgi:MFS family permease
LFSTPTNDFDAAEYVRMIQLSIDMDRNNDDASRWIDIFRGADLRRLLIAVGIQSLQQAQGSSYMNSYIVSFLESTGVTNVFPVIMGLYTLYYVAILTGHVLPDKVGRRPLLMSTAAFCGTCLIIVSSLVTAFETPSTTTQKVSIALIFLWQVSFGIQSPLIWIVTTESAPSRNREKVQAVAVFFGFGVSLLISSVSPYIQNTGYGNLGGKIVSCFSHTEGSSRLTTQGFIWGTFSIITVIWVFFVVPEMKGFTIEQLDYLFAIDVPTRKFKTYEFLDGEAGVAQEDLIQEDMAKVDVKATVVSTKHAVKKAL